MSFPFYFIKKERMKEGEMFSAHDLKAMGI